MSRRYTPRINPSHLRDHGNAERVERGWERLERELPLVMAAPPAHDGRWRWLAAAAVAASFAVGLVAGRATDVDERTVDVPVSRESPARELYVAGTRSTEHTLPTGGSLLLGPLSIVETVENQGEGLHLRLLQGEAVVSTGAGPNRQLALHVGEAQVRTELGSVRVQLDDDAADVHVLEGSASVDGPELPLQQLRPSGQAVRIRVLSRVAVVSPDVPSPSPEAPLARRGPRATTGVDDDKPASDWRPLCSSVDAAKAATIRELIFENGGALKAIEDARDNDELYCIKLAYKGRDSSRVIERQALESIVTRNPEHPTVGYELAKIYAELNEPAKAAEAYARVPEGPFQQRALCSAVRLYAAQGKLDAVVELAQRYRTKFRDECEGQLPGQLERARAVAAERGELAVPSPMEPSEAKPGAAPEADPPPGAPATP